MWRWRSSSCDNETTNRFTTTDPTRERDIFIRCSRPPRWSSAPSTAPRTRRLRPSSRLRSRSRPTVGSYYVPPPQATRTSVHRIEYRKFEEHDTVIGFMSSNVILMSRNAGKSSTDFRTSDSHGVSPVSGRRRLWRLGPFGRARFALQVQLDAEVRGTSHGGAHGGACATFLGRRELRNGLFKHLLKASRVVT